jgi:hypothetical protein
LKREPGKGENRQPDTAEGIPERGLTKKENLPCAG